MLSSIGWQVGVTYMSNRPRGLDYKYLNNLLEEMAEHGMNLLSLMMISYGYYDPLHDGYCWPTRQKSLQCYKDKNAINSDESTEFLSRIISDASDFGIEIELFLNWGIWNPDKIKVGYPDARVQVDRHGKTRGWLHCPDSPGAWQAGLDEVEDLLAFYNHPNIKRFVFERISYRSEKECYCQFTNKEFLKDNEHLLQDASPNAIQRWKRERIGQLLKEYVDHVKSIGPDIKVGIHSRGNPAWGHDPEIFKIVGIDFVEPHVLQFKTNKKQLYRDLKHLENNECILH
ncbi:MAG: hypothetical protein ACTSRA_02870, partial [Promethearchaeota archaeon]